MRNSFQKWKVSLTWSICLMQVLQFWGICCSFYVGFFSLEFWSLDVGVKKWWYIHFAVLYSIYVLLSFWDKRRLSWTFHQAGDFFFFLLLSNFLLFHRSWLYLVKFDLWLGTLHRGKFNLLGGEKNRTQWTLKQLIIYLKSQFKVLFGLK